MPVPAAAGGPPVAEVPPDQFQVVTEDTVLSAVLDATLAVCLYDAVEEHGALLHLRFIARGAQQSDVTDRTLASDLLLLDRCVEEFKAALERGTDLQGKIAANVEEGEASHATAEAVLALVGAYLADAGVKIVAQEVDYGEPRRLRFRPSMGQIRLDPLRA
jgi:chemotaxis receptor (MCP) glutamine deamidase CheD